MPFPSRLLNDDETIAVDLHPHWWYFATPVAVLLAGIALGLWRLVRDNTGWVGNVMSFVAMAALVIGAAWTIGRYLRWMTTHFVITSQRIIFRSGFVAKRGIEIPLDRVNNVNFSQTAFERIVGAGDLLIESGGEDGQSLFEDIRHPDEVQRMIHVQMEKARARRSGMGVQTAAPGGDLASQLERLEGLMQRGALSREEFEAQKRKLLEG